MSAVPITGWQAGFLSLLPAIQTHARIQFRRLPAERREEAIREAIASACISYQLLAARGKLRVAHPGPLADFAVRHVRTGRHVGGHQDAARDVLSPVAHQRHGVRLRSIDQIQPGSHTRDWMALAVADRNDSIPDTAAFRIDFAQWLRSQSRRDRRIIRYLIRGDRTCEIAGRLKISPSRVSQLRRKYEQAWRMYQGEIAA